ncbi:phosphodiester glycosidase family protein [Paraliobacillus sp. X-1268]|uniref:phosphodiester glycosidase family protein n=1 Tax=Paraliobacillus sp. X-1268 TaxID=2213193 RepID=UPI000E3E05E8|nr:phosphodiester glycosidase family protein [Paraliobacillus sp. X-1268]
MTNETTAISESETEYYDEVTYQQYRDEISETNYYVTKIPNKDKDQNFIKLNHGFQYDSMNSGEGETVRSFAHRKNVSFAANASIFNTSNNQIRGIQIQDGQILQATTYSDYYTLGIKADNTLVAYPPSISANNILQDGCLNTVTGFFPIIENGNPVDSSIFDGKNQSNEAHPRQVIAQLPNKDLLFFTVKGRTDLSKGMTYNDCIRVLQEFNVTFAYCLDGGGSTQSVVRGVLLNDPIDGDGKIERKVPDFLYVVKNVTNARNLDATTYDLGNVNKKVSDLKADLNKMGAFFDNVQVVDNLNNINKSGLYWILGSATGAPSNDTSWGIIHMQHSPNNSLQIGFPFHNTLNGMRSRRTNPNQVGTYYNWRNL